MRSGTIVVDPSAARGARSVMRRRTTRWARGLATSAAMVGAALAATACSPAAGPGESVAATVTQDAATRTTPVVAGRPARVFVYAALGEACMPLPAPTLRVVAPPSQGELSFREGQPTTLASAGGSECGGRSATGTGVYYTARDGAAGSDRFTVEARAGDGTVQSRSFEVRIEP